MTKRERFEGLKNYVKAYPEYVAFIDKEIARLDAHAAKAKEKRGERAREAGEIIREDAVKVLEEAGRPITLAELVAGITLIDKTPGKVAYHIRPLIEEGTIVKAKAKFDDRKIMTYAIAE